MGFQCEGVDELSCRLVVEDMWDEGVTHIWSY